MRLQSVRSKLNRAERLVADGRIAEAIRFLTDANRARRNTRIESRLVELRRDAHAAADRSGVKHPMPPEPREEFPGIVGLPEIHRRDLTIDTLRSGILQHGCLLVRGLVEPTRVNQLVEDIDRTFAAFDVRNDGPAAARPEWYTPFDPLTDQVIHREWIRGGDGVLA
ncbi:MAG: hypothetical protein EXQ79_10710, partial [Acidimicrobiia bacterium]|nr:hypothetical protein [Acidimicrobiia bacterium]